ncbi:MAG: hypothetical protein ACK53Y_08150, partial [bacterium]
MTLPWLRGPRPCPLTVSARCRLAGCTFEAVGAGSVAITGVDAMWSVHLPRAQRPPITHTTALHVADVTVVGLMPCAATGRGAGSGGAGWSHARPWRDSVPLAVVCRAGAAPLAFSPGVGGARATRAGPGLPQAVDVRPASSPPSTGPHAATATP